MDQTAGNKKRFIRGRDFVATMASLASAGFGVMAALAWNEAIKAAVTRMFGQGRIVELPGGGSGTTQVTGGEIISYFTYAAIVTAIAVLVVTMLARMTERFGGEKRL